MTARAVVLLDGDQAQTLLDHVLEVWMVDNDHPIASALRAIASGAACVVPANFAATPMIKALREIRDSDRSSQRNKRIAREALFAWENAVAAPARESDPTRGVCGDVEP